VIASGDVIVAVGGAPCRGLALDGLTRLVQGAEGSKVELTLRRGGGEPRTVTATRGSSAA
jgi:C-terminal processing protease CtpA/Prc